MTSVNHITCEWVLILWSSHEPTQLRATSRLTDITMTLAIPSSLDLIANSESPT